MARPPAPLPPQLLGRPFTVHEARAAAVPAGRLRASDLVTPFHGVRVGSQPIILADRARAYAMRMPHHEAFSHATAAALQGMRMPNRHVEPRLHVSSLAPWRAPRSRGVVGHRLSPTTRTTRVEELRVVVPVDAWVQCASILPLDDLIVMGDGLLSRNRPRTTKAELAALLAGLAGHRGVARLRRALEQMRPSTDSARETSLRVLIVRAGFPEPEVNGEIRNEYGAVIAHGDLVYREQKVILEYDGGVHREDDQYFHDIYRLDNLMEEGWRVIRVDKYLLAAPASLFAKLAKALG